MSNPHLFLMRYNKMMADYRKKRVLIAPEGEERERQTLEILAKFQEKLSAAAKDHSTPEEPKFSDNAGQAYDDNEWLCHELHSEDKIPVAKDSNLPSADCDD